MIEVNRVIPAASLPIIQTPNSTTSSIVVHEGTLARLASLGSPYWLNPVTTQTQLLALDRSEYPANSLIFCKENEQVYYLDQSSLPSSWKSIIKSSKYLTENLLIYCSDTGLDSNTGLTAQEPKSWSSLLEYLTGTITNGFTVTITFLTNFTQQLDLPQIIGGSLLLQGINQNIEVGFNTGNSSGFFLTRLRTIGLSLLSSNWINCHDLIFDTNTKIIEQQNLQNSRSKVLYCQINNTLVGSIWKASENSIIRFDATIFSLSNNPQISSSIVELNSNSFCFVNSNLSGLMSGVITGKKYTLYYPSNISDGQLLPGTIDGELNYGILSPVAFTGSFNDLNDRPDLSYGHIIREQGIIQPIKPALDFTGNGVNIIPLSDRLEINIDQSSLFDTDKDGKVDPAKGGTGLDSSSATGFLRFSIGNPSIIEPFLGHNIIDNGFPVTDRRFMEFTGSGVTVQDDQPGNKTIVNITNSAQPAYTFTASQFVQSSSPVTITVISTQWIAVGSIIFIQTAGYYSVQNILSSTSISIQNLGYSVNAPVGEILITGLMVMSSGIEGPTGLPGTVGLTSGLILNNRTVGPLAQAGKTIIWSDNSIVYSLSETGVTTELNGPRINTQFISNLAFNSQFSLNPISGNGLEVSLNPLTTAEVTEVNNGGLYFTNQRVLNVVNALLGSSSSLNYGTAPGNVVRLGGSGSIGQLPAVDGSQLTGIKQRAIVKSNGSTIADQPSINFIGPVITNDPINSQIIIDTSSASRLNGQLASYYLDRNNHTGTMPLTGLNRSGAAFNQYVGWNGVSWSPMTFSPIVNQAPITLQVQRELLTTDLTIIDPEDIVQVYVLNPNGQSRQLVLPNSAPVNGIYCYVYSLDVTYPLLINHLGTVIGELSSMSSKTWVLLLWTGTEWLIIN